MKKRYWIAVIALSCGLLSIASGCNKTVEDDTKKEESAGYDEVVEDVENVGDAGQNDSLTFSTQDIYGEEVTEEIFKDYDLTLVNIFATWCSPCIAEMPELAMLDQNMEEKNVNVVAVCIDSLNARGELDLNALALAQQIAEVSEAKFQFLVPDAAYFNGRLANVQAVPESFFVDCNGTVVGETYVGARDLAAWTQIVEQELSNLNADK